MVIGTDIEAGVVLVVEPFDELVSPGDCISLSCRSGGIIMNLTAVRAAQG